MEDSKDVSGIAWDAVVEKDDSIEHKRLCEECNALECKDCWEEWSNQSSIEEECSEVLEIGCEVKVLWFDEGGDLLAREREETEQDKNCTKKRREMIAVKQYVKYAVENNARC